MSKDHLKLWSRTILTTFVLFFLYSFLVLGVNADFDVFMGGANPHALVFVLADNIIAMGMIFMLIPFFKAKFNYQGNLIQKLSSSAFHIYLIHPPILILVSLSFASIPLFPVIKLAIVYPLTVALCYLVSHYVLQKIQLSKHKRVTQNS
jgi:surface polysaccharide O-acyltransferase-like enzyme